MTTTPRPPPRPPAQAPPPARPRPAPAPAAARPAAPGSTLPPPRPPAAPPPGAWEPVRFHVGGTEMLHLGASLVALTVAFSFAFAHFRNPSLLVMPDDREVASAVGFLPYAFVIVVLGFLLHEMAHKFVAQRLALWAEFRASAGGLGAALVLCIFTTVIFAAPGAVLIVGNATRRDSGIISVAGPLTNIVIGLALLPLAHAGPNPVEVGNIGNFFQLAVLVNALLAVFNLLPFPPLDGSKIARWSVPGYLGMLALAGALFYFGAFAA